MIENSFRAQTPPKGANLKRFFIKRQTFPTKLDALHKKTAQNVVNATLAKGGGFFYTFIIEKKKNAVSHGHWQVQLAGGSLAQERG